MISRLEKHQYRGNNKKKKTKSKHKSSFRPLPVTFMVYCVFDTTASFSQHGHGYEGRLICHQGYSLKQKVSVWFSELNMILTLDSSDRGFKCGSPWTPAQHIKILLWHLASWGRQISDRIFKLQPSLEASSQAIKQPYPGQTRARWQEDINISKNTHL